MVLDVCLCPVCDGVCFDRLYKLFQYCCTPSFLFVGFGWIINGIKDNSKCNFQHEHPLLIQFLPPLAHHKHHKHTRIVPIITFPNPTTTITTTTFITHPYFIHTFAFRLFMLVCLRYHKLE